MKRLKKYAKNSWQRGGRRNRLPFRFQRPFPTPKNLAPIFAQKKTAS